MDFRLPRCGHRQPFKWECVEWSKSARDEFGDWDFDEVRRTTAMRCESCNHHFDDGDRMRRELNATASSSSKNPKASKENVGFHWNALCAMSWGQLGGVLSARQGGGTQGGCVAAPAVLSKAARPAVARIRRGLQAGDRQVGYKRGETWEEEGAICPKTRAILAAPLPERTGLIPLRFITVDCQMDHLFLVVRSWSAEGSSRLMWNERILTFTDVDVMQERFDVHPSLVFVDAGHATYDVYRECSKRGWVALIGDRRPVYAHKGRDGKTVQRFYSPRRKVVLSHKQTCHVHYWSNLNIKDTLARLRRNQDPSRGPTWEVPDDIDDEYPRPDGKRAAGEGKGPVDVEADRFTAEPLL